MEKMVRFYVTIETKDGDILTLVSRSVIFGVIHVDVAKDIFKRIINISKEPPINLESIKVIKDRNNILALHLDKSQSNSLSL